MTKRTVPDSFLPGLSLPTAMEMPKIDLGHVESPSPFTALGSKGIGEASCMSVPPAIGNAIADALSVLGVTINELPLTPNKIWHLLQEAKSKKRNLNWKR